MVTEIEPRNKTVIGSLVLTDLPYREESKEVVITEKPIISIGGLTHTIEFGIIYARKGIFDPDGILEQTGEVEHCPD